MKPRKRKTILIFSLAASLGLSLLGIISQEIFVREHSSIYYVLTLAIIGCILLLLTGFVWDRQTATEIEKIGETVKREIPFTSSFSFKEEGGIMGLAQQIEKMARSLQQVEASYRAIVEDQTELICRFRRGGQLTFVNEAYSRICEKRPQDLIGELFLPLSPDTGSQRDAHLIHNLTPEQGTVTVEHAVSDLHEKNLWFQWTCRGFFDAQGNVYEYQAIGRDITERKAAEEEIKRLAAFPESNPNPILEFSRKGEITYMNEATRETVRSSNYRNVWEILPQEASSIALRCLQEKTPIDSIEKRSGQRTFSWSFYPQCTSHIVHAYGQEITRQRDLEKKLYQAQKLEELGTLSGGIAHEFNNLLVVICGYSEFSLQKLTPSHPLHKNLTNILTAGKRGTTLVKQILTFARQTDVIFSSVDINEVLLEHHNLLEGTFSKMISVELDLAENLPRIRAEPHQLEQILMNLSINARDSMPEGGSLRFRTMKATADQLPQKEPPPLSEDYVCICVSDTGHGIDNEVCTKIFDPFFTTKEHSKGTGLGLSVVYGIVQNHGGAIDVKSLQGKGTDFFLYFPVSVLSTTAHPIEKSESISNGGDETILIVDDEPQILEWIQELLSKKGYTTITATSGPEALEIFQARSNEIDLVISDLDMPRMSGLQLLKELKKVSSDLSFIASTGYIDPAVKTRMFVEGMVDFINKPFRGEGLLAKIRKVLDRAGNGCFETNTEKLESR